MLKFLPGGYIVHEEEGSSVVELSQ